MEKVIFVDFDDTICLHRFHIQIDERMFYSINKASELFYENSELNHQLYKYLLEEQKKGANIVLLSSACSKMLDIKKHWLNQNCNLLKFNDFIASSIDISKTDIMCSYAKYNNIDINDIVLIDDNCTERKDAQKKGILTFNPQLIMNK